MEPMRLHAEDAGHMGKTVCAFRLYKQAVSNTHLVLFVRIADNRFGGQSKTGRAVDHLLNGGVSASREDTRLRMALFSALFPSAAFWVHFHEM